MFSCEFCETSKDTFFLQNTSGGCFCVQNISDFLDCRIDLIYIQQSIFRIVNFFHPETTSFFSLKSPFDQISHYKHHHQKSHTRQVIASLRCNISVACFVTNKRSAFSRTFWAVLFTFLSKIMNETVKRNRNSFTKKSANTNSLNEKVKKRKKIIKGDFEPYQHRNIVLNK